MHSVCESIGYMQQLCGETGLNVTQGKRVQRQVRYDKLKVEFSNFCEKLLNGDSRAIFGLIVKAGWFKIWKPIGETTRRKWSCIKIKSRKCAKTWSYSNRTSSNFKRRTRVWNPGLRTSLAIKRWNRWINCLEISNSLTIGFLTITE